MEAQELRDAQAPLKQQYRDDPGVARKTLCAEGRLADGDVVCHVQCHSGDVAAGLHPATGGSGAEACSAEMLLEALIGCAGVTLKAVSTALECPLKDVRITAEGDMDFRGTLGVDRDAPIGLTAVRLEFHVGDDVDPPMLEKLISLTERYCVVLQTLKAGVAIESRTSRSGA